MDVTNSHLVIIKNSYLNNFFFFKRFCKASCFNFFPGQNSFVVNHISFNFLSGQSGFLSDFWLGILNLKNAKNL